MAGPMRAELPPTEDARLAALQALGIMDTAAERVFDDIVLLASFICDTPTALISLVDRDRQWFKARVGMEAQQTHRDLAFCAHAILTPDRMTVVRDAVDDKRFADNDLVHGEPPIRFYAGAPLVTDDGHALGTLCVIDQKPRDMNAKRRAALQSLARHTVHLLNMRRAVATAKHQEDKRLMQLNTIAHDLATPLTPIVGYARLLEAMGSEFTPDQKEALNVMRANAEHLERLIGDVRDLATLEVERLSILPAAMSVTAVAKEVVASLQPRAAGLGVDIVVRTEEDVTIDADRDRVTQVLMNLATNALKFTPSGGTITVSVGVSDDEVRFTVADTGRGLTPDETFEVFKPFAQARAVGEAPHEGSGLGLFISAGIAKAHDGSLTVVSKGRGEGSAFTLALPRS